MTDRYEPNPEAVDPTDDDNDPDTYPTEDDQPAADEDVQDPDAQ